jgi:hypothetical protein
MLQSPKSEQELRKAGRRENLNRKKRTREPMREKQQGIA